MIMLSYYQYVSFTSYFLTSNNKFNFNSLMNFSFIFWIVTFFLSSLLISLIKPWKPIKIRQWKPTWKELQLQQRKCSSKEKRKKMELEDGISKSLNYTTTFWYMFSLAQQLKRLPKPASFQVHGDICGHISLVLWTWMMWSIWGPYAPQGDVIRKQRLLACVGST